MRRGIPSILRNNTIFCLLFITLSQVQLLNAEQNWPHERGGFGLEEEQTTSDTGAAVTREEAKGVELKRSAPSQKVPEVARQKNSPKPDTVESELYVDLSHLPEPPTSKAADSSVKQELVPLPRNLKVVGGEKGESFVEISAEQESNVRPVQAKKYWDFAGKQEQIEEPIDFVQGSEERSPYTVGIGDRLLISIYGEPNTERDVVVDRAGTITYPIVGRMSVRGKTIDQIRQQMDEKISTVYRYTFVNITPIQFGRQSYTIMGEVNQPGRKLLLGKETVLSAICRAGGFTEGSFRTQTIDMADLDHAFLMRDDEYVPIDFEKLVVEGDLSEDVKLQSGDYIYIPSALEKEIFVLGEVAIPSSLGFVNRMSLLESLALAGGTTFNASSRAVVVRGSLKDPYTFHIDINLMQKGVYPDFALLPGDIVYVPPRQFTLLRQITEFAVRIFVSTFASDAGTRAFNSIINGDAVNSVNVIPSGSAPVNPGISTGGPTVIVP